MIYFRPNPLKSVQKVTRNKQNNCNKHCSQMKLPGGSCDYGGLPSAQMKNENNSTCKLYKLFFLKKMFQQM